MENMSILNLFNFTNTVEVTSSSVQTPVQQGEFENVFKKYLDRSQQPEAKDTATDQRQQESVKAEEPETPEEVIDNLDIPEEQKAELKRMLEEAETTEEVSNVLDELIAMMQEQGAELEDVEAALTDIAKSILTEQDNRTQKDSILLEASLDKIVAVQAQQTQNTPQLTVVKTDDSVSADGDSAGKESRKEALMNMVQKNSDQLPADVKEKIIELASKVNEKTQTNDADNGFTMKTDMTEKVIKTEVRIESPRDIMKFAELVELAKSQRANKLEVQLHPQELGKVSIQLTEQAGKVTGKIIFESESARHLFANNAESFRQQLADKGIVVENLEFLFKDMDQHEFAGWEGKEGKKGKGSADGGLNLNNGSEETDSEETDGIYA